MSVACVDAGRVLGFGSCGEEGMETRRWVARARGTAKRVTRFERCILSVGGDVVIVGELDENSTTLGEVHDPWG